MKLILSLTALIFTGTALRAQVVALLVELLHAPRGIPRAWWAVRMSWMPRRELEWRMAALRAALFE